MPRFLYLILSQNLGRMLGPMDPFNRGLLMMLMSMKSIMKYMIRLKLIKNVLNFNTSINRIHINQLPAEKFYDLTEVKN